ncbi:hypothetical protein EVG20_g8699 [Dentipellis fragilis]|uniref:Uncharacterized protein n=1 Tax=Dentipellis fragilis TaxID=205917 RepID=A0A4Y9Y4B2_9AGAM|nr:hypothetical protein EVG20_g8699 [Dentipellis fragilis]
MARVLNPNSVLQPDNPMAPIDRLPVEILARIFRALIALHHPNLRSANHYEPWASSLNREVDITLRWLPVTHVSQRWRAVALQNALLWTTVYADLGLSGTQEMLARSKGLPLDMQIDLKHAHAIPDAVAQNMSRVVHLDLRVRDAKGLENPGSFLVTPAPGPGNVIPSSHLDELLEALSRMPNLTSLSLIDCLPHVRITDDEFWTMAEPGHTPVRLPSLCALDVRGSATDIAALLPHLSVSATCKMDITYNVPWDIFSNSTSDIDEFGPLLQRSLNMLGKPVLRLAICAAKNSYELSLWTCTHPWPDTSPIPPGASHSRSAHPARPDVRIIASRQLLFGEKSVPFAVYPADVEDLPLGSVQIVDITDRSQVWQPEWWGALLSHMDDVRHIRVNRSLGLDLAQSLTEDVVPRLETLMFADEPWIDDGVMAETSEILEELSESLHQRVGSTVPLEKLYFQGYLPDIGEEIEEMYDMLSMKQSVSLELIDESP